MSRNKYAGTTNKLLALPSGAEVTIRMLQAGDFRGLGVVPVVDAEAKGKKTEPSPREVEFGLTFGNRILTTCTGPLKFEGESLTIVAKPFSQCKETEISIEEIQQADAEMIINEVLSFSGLRKEGGARNGHTFQQDAVADPGPNGEALRDAATSNSTHVD